MKKLLSTLFSAGITVFFLVLTYFYALALFLAYSVKVELKLFIPWGRAFLSAPLWYCFLVTCGTCLLGLLCWWLHCKLNLERAKGLEPKTFDWGALGIRFTVEHTEQKKKISRVVWAVLFALSILAVSIPKLAFVPFLSEGTVNIVEEYLWSNANSAVTANTVEAAEVSTTAGYAVVQQCLVFFFGYHLLRQLPNAKKRMNSAK